MNSGFRLISLLFSFLLIIVLFAGCDEEQPQQTNQGFLFFGAKAEPTAARIIVPPEVARQVELEIEWSYVVPLKKSEKFKNFSLIDDRLYVVTSSNYLVSMDGKKADPVYSWQLADPIATLCELRKYQDQLYSIVGGDLLVLDAQEGTILREKSLGYGPVCPPARNSNYFYVPGADRRIHVMNASDMVKLFHVSANDGGGITSVLADDEIVLFSTDAGTVAAMMTDQPVQYWRFQAARGVNGPIVDDGKNIIFSGRDAYIYSLDRKTGKLSWKYLTDALLTNPPRVTEDYVYQSIDSGGLLVIDKETGELAWRLDDGVD